MSPSPASAPPRRGLRIALLAAYFDNEYEWAICKGVRGAVEEAGGSVLYVAGAGLSDPNPGHQARASLYNLVDSSTADAILSVSGVIGHFVGTAATGAWLQKFGLPVASVGVADGVPSVSIDDARGIVQLIEHLVLQHDRKRIAFVSGIPTNPQANKRLEAYYTGLREFGLTPDPKLVVPGDFTRESGTRAMCELFDRRQVKVSEFDAIIAANDYMAFGVVDELVRRRISVPDQLAVVGFDDITLARYHEPSLSTVRQPLEQLGREAVRLLFDRLDQKAVAESNELSTELVLRRSCGCVPTDIPGSDEGAGELDETREVLPALAAEINGATGAFARALDPLLRRLAAGSSYQLEQNRKLADELATRLRLARGDLIHERLHKLSRQLYSRMFSPRAQLSTLLAEHLPHLGLDECVVSEFVPDKGRSELRLSFGFSAEELQPQSVTYPTRQIVPPGFPNLRRRSVLALPLCYGDELLGIAVMPAIDGDGSLYESLAQCFGVVLKSMDLRRRAEARSGPT
jgi:sigma-B regulation protein RsbU (phosphoserine phosphatase)